MILTMQRHEIKQLRNDLSLTQVEFGQLLGAHAVTVSRWETDSSVQPTPYQMALLFEFQKAAKEQAFGRTVKNLLIGAGIAAAIYLLLQVTRES